MSEEEVVLLQEELDVVRKVLTRCQAECSSTKKLLSRKVHEVMLTHNTLTLMVYNHMISIIIGHILLLKI